MFCSYTALDEYTFVALQMEHHSIAHQQHSGPHDNYGAGHAELRPSSPERVMPENR